jgi:hypothetical protein
MEKGEWGEGRGRKAGERREKGVHLFIVEYMPVVVVRALNVAQ